MISISIFIFIFGLFQFAIGFYYGKKAGLLKAERNILQAKLEIIKEVECEMLELGYKSKDAV